MCSNGNYDARLMEELRLGCGPVQLGERELGVRLLLPMQAARELLFHATLQRLVVTD